MIHVAFGTSNLYAKFVGTAMISIFENAILTPPHRITVHILHDNTFSQENRDKFIYLAGQYNQQVKFYNVEKLVPNDVAKLQVYFNQDKKKRLPVVTFYRLLLAKVVTDEIDKIIYLDADILVNLDINELYKIEIGEKIFAALPETENQVKPTVFSLCREGLVKNGEYFNTGVMLIDLKKFLQNEQKILDGLNYITSHPQYKFQEQDTLNYCFWDNYLKLPLKFNCFVKRKRSFKTINLEKNIYHYINGALGYGMDINDVYNKLFFEYFTKTPWCTPEAFGNLSKEIEKFFDERQNLSIRLTASLSGKKRAFFTDAKTFETVRTSLLCQPDEKIILKMAADPAEELAELITESAGKELFLVFTDNYRACKDALIKKGFSEWRDFIDGKIFFSSAQGVKLNTFRFVEQM